MAFSFGSFAGGAAEGLANGANLAEKYQKLNEIARQRAARKALGTTYASGIGIGDGATPAIAAGPQPPMPGQASVPATPDAPRNDDYAAMAAMAPAGTPQPPPIANDDYAAMAAATPATGAPPMPGQASMPNTPPSIAGPATGANGTPLSGTAAPSAQPGADQAQQLTSTITDANNTIKAISDAVKRANPGIDPETLVNAVQQHIEQMKGVRNEVKDYMVAQAEYAKHQLGEDRIKGRITETITKVAGQQNVAETNAASREQVGAGHDAARTTAAGLQADARVKASVNAAAATIGAANIRKAASDSATRDRVEGMLEGAAIRAGATADQARVAAKARVDAAIAMAGGTPDGKVAAMPATRATKAAAAASPYKTPADVAAAYHSGKINRNDAAAILKNQFGAQ